MRSGLAAFAIALTLSCNGGFRQAFGIEAGTRLTDLASAQQFLEGFDLYYIQVPYPHPEFEGYTARIPHGVVCEVSGLGKEYDDLSPSLRAAYMSLYTALEGRYGKSFTVELSDHGPFAIWDERSGSSLPPDLARVKLITIGAPVAQIMLIYEFRDREHCGSQSDAREEQGL